MTSEEFRRLGARDLASVTPEQIAAVRGKSATGAKQTSVAQRARGLAPHSRSEMNKTEILYQQHLELEKIAGNVADFRFQEIRFRFAEKTFHAPDFFVQLTGSGLIEIHEVKGGEKKTGRPRFTEDGWLRFKLGRENFPMFRWRLMYLLDGRWHEWEAANEKDMAA